MAKEISKLVSYNMNDGKIYIGICDKMDWDNRQINLIDACEIQPEMVTKDYKQRVKELYNTYKVKRDIPIKIDDIKSQYIID